MDDRRVGAALRALRLRRGLRQIDLAILAGVSQQTISLIERGHWEFLSLRTVRAVFAALDATFDGEVRWRAGALDRLLDERHALLVGEIGGQVQALGWEVATEVTFSHFGERGSVDLLAIHRASGTALVIEAKTQLVSIEQMLRRLDVKARLSRGLVRDRFGVGPSDVGRLVVILESSTARRRVEREAAVLGLALPQRTAEVRRWLQRPAGAIAGLWFLPLTHGGGSRQRVVTPGRRIRVPGSSAEREPTARGGPNAAAGAGFLDSTTGVGD
jgi:transcriptional regulator with XRE-family HTH domain